MFDTTGYNGSSGTGTKLYTDCRVGDHLNWAIRPLNPNDEVTISEISGPAVADGILLNLEQVREHGVSCWTALVGSRWHDRIAKYHLSLNVNGLTLTYDPLVAVAGPGT
ncbi:hypothetical protein FBZ89_12666 [Nitrospirillum amazonense]|uniref:Uncharacterized protein n=2 Tax=Nitrospirillum amazonense TaxID=28077 RepID=A0A560ESK0_9PROT|nr:hypothetical protein FBZ89_12666 [Nitrospirillum amazonense]